jgi:hypothetical protein
MAVTLPHDPTDGVVPVLAGRLEVAGDEDVVAPQRLLPVLREGVHVSRQLIRTDRVLVPHHRVGDHEVRQAQLTSDLKFLDDVLRGAARRRRPVRQNGDEGCAAPLRLWKPES